MAWKYTKNPASGSRLLYTGKLLKALTPPVLLLWNEWKDKRSQIYIRKVLSLFLCQLLKKGHHIVTQQSCPLLLLWEFCEPWMHVQTTHFSVLGTTFWTSPSPRTLKSCKMASTLGTVVALSSDTSTRRAPIIPVWEGGVGEEEERWERGSGRTSKYLEGPTVGSDVRFQWIIPLRYLLNKTQRKMLSTKQCVCVSYDRFKKNYASIVWYVIL